jgi:hypothetical protein
MVIPPTLSLHFGKILSVAIQLDVAICNLRLVNFAGYKDDVTFGSLQSLQW